MLLDLRIVLAASFAAVLLLIGGFGLVAALRTPGKPSVGLSPAPVEITGSVRTPAEKNHTLTDDDKAARPMQPVAESQPSAPAAPRTVNLEKAEKAEKSEKSEKPAPPKSAAAKPAPKVAAKPKPRIRAVRQPPGTNFQNNNPFGTWFGTPTTTADE